MAEPTTLRQTEKIRRKTPSRSETTQTPRYLKVPDRQQRARRIRDPNTEKRASPRHDAPSMGVGPDTRADRKVGRVVGCGGAFREGIDTG